MPILVVGLPSSGKTTLAHILGGKILEFDSLAKKYHSYADLNEEKDVAFEMFKTLARVQQPRIIVDVFSSRQRRIEMIEALESDTFIIIVDCPLNLCLMRNSARCGSLVTNDEIRHAYMAFEPVHIDEGYKSIHLWNSLINRMTRIA